MEDVLDRCDCARSTWAAAIGQLQNSGLPCSKQNTMYPNSASKSKENSYTRCTVQEKAEMQSQNANANIETDHGRLHELAKARNPSPGWPKKDSCSLERNNPFGIQRRISDLAKQPDSKNTRDVHGREPLLARIVVIGAQKGLSYRKSQEQTAPDPLCTRTMEMKRTTTWNLIRTSSSGIPLTAHPSTQLFQRVSRPSVFIHWPVRKSPNQLSST